LTYGTPDIDFTDSHTYAEPGLYRVTVTATDQSGAQMTATTYAVQQASQSISFRAIGSQQYGQPPVPIVAEGGSSGNPVVLSSATPSVCSVANPHYNNPRAGEQAQTSALVDLLGAGTCTVTANQLGAYFQEGTPACTPTGCALGADVVQVYSAADQVEDSFTIEPAQLQIDPAPEEMTYGGPVPSFSVSYHSFVDGDTSSVVSGLSCGPVDSSGNPVSPATAPAGVYTITCSGASAPNYNISYGLAILQVDRAATKTSLSSQPGSSVWGQAVTFTATVSVEAPGGGTPTGTVAFGDISHGIAGCSAQPVDPATGTASCTTSALSVGVHSIYATYSGGHNFVGSRVSGLTQTVGKAGTTTVVGSANGAIMAGQAASFTATVAATAPGAGVPSGTVTFYDGTKDLGTAPLDSGQASLQANGLALGAHSVTASYGGDGDFNSSSSATITQYVDTNVSSFPKLADGAYDLSNSNLSGAYFGGANLAGASLAGSNLAGAVFVDADLNGADMADSNFKGADFAGANLAGARLAGSNLAGAVFVDADLNGADMADGNFKGADFAGADLLKADLAGSNLAGANLTSADLAGAKLSNVNLRGAIWGGTTCPDGTSSNADGGSCSGHL
jgi:uncharacterized protein YjbI with pentapeptide repeats